MEITTSTWVHDSGMGKVFIQYDPACDQSMQYSITYKNPTELFGGQGEPAQTLTIDSLTRGDLFEICYCIQASLDISAAEEN